MARKPITTQSIASAKIDDVASSPEMQRLHSERGKRTEDRLTKATAQIHKLWVQKTNLESEIAAENAMAAKLQEQIAGVERERALLAARPERRELVEALRKQETLRGEVAHANRMVELLEAHCATKNINPNAGPVGV